MQTSMKKNSHTEDYEENESHSDDLAKGDFGGRNTDAMSPADKDYEDHYNQGGHNSGGTSEIKNQAVHTLPGSWEKFGPTNVPKHMTTADYQSAAPPESSSNSNVVLVYITVDNDEHAVRFVKALFNKGLIASANQYEGNFERTYLKLGRMSTEKGRDKLELTTTGDKVAALIDYTNQHNPTSYDYPVPDTVVLPVETGNAKYIAWVKKQIASFDGGLHEDGQHEEGHDDEGAE